MKPAMRYILRTLWVCPLVFAADRVTKILAAGLESPVALIPGILGLRYTVNSGIAFSLFSGAPRVLGVLTVLLLTAALYFLCRLRLRTPTWILVMLTLGGALGNALDRILLGYVPDMVEILAFRWGIFNVADIAVVTGILLLALRMFTHPDEWKVSDGNDHKDSHGDR